MLQHSVSPRGYKLAREEAGSQMSATRVLARRQDIVSPSVDISSVVASNSSTPAEASRGMGQLVEETSTNRGDVRHHPYDSKKLLYMHNTACLNLQMTSTIWLDYSCDISIFQMNRAHVDISWWLRFRDSYWRFHLFVFSNSQESIRCQITRVSDAEGSSCVSQERQAH